MTKFCESCHTPNRDRARYCCGCAGKFSGIRSGTTTFDTTVSEPRWLQTASPSLLPLNAAVLKQKSQRAPRRIGFIPVPHGVDVSIVWLLIVLALLYGAFVFWYLGRSAMSGPTLSSAISSLLQSANLPTERTEAPPSQSPLVPVGPSTATSPRLLPAL